jgi:hypothetical protein
MKPRYMQIVVHTVDPFVAGLDVSDDCRTWRDTGQRSTYDPVKGFVFRGDFDVAYNCQVVERDGQQVVEPR